MKHLISKLLCGIGFHDFFKSFSNDKYRFADECRRCGKNNTPKEQEKKAMWGTIILVVMSVILANLLSCRPTKSLTVSEKDRKDSIVYRTRIDTLILKDSVKLQTVVQGFSQREILELMKLMRSGKDTTLQLAGTGQTQLHIHNGYGELTTKSEDKSRFYYQHSLDSLRAELTKSKESNKVEVRGMTFLEKLLGIGGGILLLVGLIAFFWIRHKIKSTF